MKLYDAIINAFDQARNFVVTARVGDRLTGRARQPYGVATSPPIGSKALCGNIDNDPAKNRIIIAYNEGAAPTDLREGEVEIYNSVSGNKIRLRTNGSIWLQNENGLIALEQNGDVSIQGNLTVNGNITTPNEVTAGEESITLTGHTHLVSGNPISPPIEQ